MGIEINGSTYETDEEGYLINLADWNKDIAEYIAVEEKVALTDNHWEVINFLRDYYNEYQIAPTPATGDLFWVEVEVKNDKAYPTSSDRAVAVKRAVMDRITVSAAGGAEIVEAPAGPTAVDPWNRAAQSEVVAAKGAEFRLKGHETKRFCALVKMTGAEGNVEFAVRSKMGGAAAKKITLRAE